MMYWCIILFTIIGHGEMLVVLLLSHSTEFFSSPKNPVTMFVRRHSANSELFNEFVIKIFYYLFIYINKQIY